MRAFAAPQPSRRSRGPSGTCSPSSLHSRQGGSRGSCPRMGGTKKGEITRRSFAYFPCRRRLFSAFGSHRKRCPAAPRSACHQPPACCRSQPATREPNPSSQELFNRLCQNKKTFTVGLMLFTGSNVCDAEAPAIISTSAARLRASPPQQSSAQQGFPPPSAQPRS